MKKTLLILLIGSTLFVASCFDSNQKDYSEVNEWIRSTMKENYLWNERIPESTSGNIPTGAYFGSLLHPDDFYSYITDVEVNLNPEFIYTSGVSPAFGRFSNSDRVFASVEFVYPNSPAAEAGISRGDIILAVNGITLTLQNYLEVFYQNSSSVEYTLGEYYPAQNSIEVLDGVVTADQGDFEFNPIVYSKIIEEGSNKIGYLLYGRFADGDNDRFIDSVDAVLQTMKTAGITDIIVDLRYNKGGDIAAAENLANALVSTSAAQNEEVFVNFKYNDIIQQRIEQRNGADSDSLQRTFSVDNENLGLTSVYFLTTSRTSSTSELLINGLIPHNDVTIIGETTEGSFYGSKAFYGKNSTPPNNNIIVPIIIKYENSDPSTNLYSGLVPTIKVEDNILIFTPIGDKEDPALKEAISTITGSSSSSKIFDKKYELLTDFTAKRISSIIF